MRASVPRGTAKDRALRLLATRWRSRAELAGRLRRAGFEEQEVVQALDELAAAGLVDDERFAAELVRSHVNGRLSGSRAIRDALRQKGVSTENAAAALGGIGDDVERALALASRRANRLSGVPPAAASRRLFSLLVRRGYGPVVAEEATRIALARLSGDGGGGPQADLPK